ncbi:MAG: hypothetical protein KBC96_04010 [Armatimonadetes bacterium]|nr:hypothetical protein [Armatimonadota bacterium]
MIRTSITVLFSLLLGAGIAHATPSELIVCGGSEVYIFDTSSTDSPPKKLWTWRAADHPEIPEDARKRFGSTADCKPVRGGRKILITSSGGGVALVDRASGKCEFCAVVPYAHSADIVPNGRIVVAASTSSELVVLDGKSPAKIICTADLVSAHGVVWDRARRTLWALGDKEIRSYRLRGWYSDAPQLELSGTHPLPEGGGHDLYPVPGTSMLSVSAWSRCFLFDTETHGIRPHDLLLKAYSIKSLDLSPDTGRLAYVQAEGGNWWSDDIHLLNPSGTITLPGERIYKARWSATPP